MSVRETSKLTLTTVYQFHVTSSSTWISVTGDQFEHPLATLTVHLNKLKAAVAQRKDSCLREEALMSKEPTTVSRQVNPCTVYYSLHANQLLDVATNVAVIYQRKKPN